MSEPTISNVEAKIEVCYNILSEPLSMSRWAKIVSEYNALNIKLCQLKGEQPIVEHYANNHLISK